MKRNISLLICLLICLQLVFLAPLYSSNYTVFAYSDNGVSGVSVVLKGHKFNSDPRPILYIEEGYAKLFGTEHAIFWIRLENAKWLTDSDFENSTFLEEMQSEPSIYGNTFATFTRLSDEIVQADVYNPDAYRDYELIARIPLLTEVLGNGDVNVTIDSRDSYVSSGTYTYAVGVDTININYIYLEQIPTVYENHKFATSDAAALVIRELIKDGFASRPESSAPEVFDLKLENAKWSSQAELDDYINTYYASVNGMELVSFSRVDDTTVNIAVYDDKTKISAMQMPMLCQVGSAGDATITVIPHNPTALGGTYKFATVIKSSGGGSGGGGGSTIQTPTSSNVNADDELSEAIKSDSSPIISLSNDADAKVKISPSIIDNLASSNKSLTIEKEGISLLFAPQSLMTTELAQSLNNTGSKLEIGAKSLTEDQAKEILSNTPFGDSTGIFRIGGKVFDLTAQIVSSSGSTQVIKSFSEPVAITIDLSEMHLTEKEISQLTGIRYKKDNKGNIIPVLLGGTYDPEKKTLTFFTDQFSFYGVVKANKMKSISLTIDSLNSKVNGVNKANDAAPIIINNRTMVPVRFIAENLGVEVAWDEETKTVQLKLDGKTLTMVIDQPLSGFDTSPIIVNGRTLVPLRYVSEKLGANILWFPTSKEIQITK
ncbi:MAG: copper amine oxidase N-terminal domain-containing protein [Bacillota bacterium]